MSISLTAQIAEEDVIAVSANQVSSVLNDGESAILNFQTGAYYGLNQVGVRVWELLQEPKTLAQLCQVILDEYEIDLPSCKKDLRELVSELAKVGLVNISHA